MDVTEQIAMEVLFNTAGFLMAAGLWWLFTKSGHRTVVTESGSVSGQSTTVEIPTPENLNRKSIKSERDVSEIQYLNLDSGNRAQRKGIRPEPEQTSKRSATRQHLERRVEVMRQAKQMLNQGTTTTEIKRSLPLTDGELALLQSV